MDDLADWAKLGALPTFAVVGLGGAGSDAVRDLVDLGLSPQVHPVAINTDAQHLLGLGLDERILIGQRELRGRGSGGDRAGVLRAAEDSREEILRRLRNYEVVFLLAGLGGGTGSTLLPYLCRELRRTEALPIPIVFLPFAIELQTNPARRETVDYALGELEALGGLLVALDNEKLRRHEALPMQRVFRFRSSYLRQLIESLQDMVNGSSQMNVDLATLRNHLGDSGLSTVLVGEHHYSEPDRLVHTALKDSLLDFELSPETSALIHLDGGSNLTLRTIDRVLRTMHESLHAPRRVVLGTRIRAESREVVRLTAVVGGLKPRTMRQALHRTGPVPGVPLVR